MSNVEGNVGVEGIKYLLGFGVKPYFAAAAPLTSINPVNTPLFPI